jgi:hypothetical protein
MIVAAWDVEDIQHHDDVKKLMDGADEHYTKYIYT